MAIKVAKLEPDIVSALNINVQIFNYIYGTAANNSLVGTDGADYISGKEGNDQLRGAGGLDLIHGDAGNDRIAGEHGGDVLYGDAGDDEVNGGYGNDIAYGGIGNDLVQGGSDNDKLYGDEGDDWLVGDLGDDTMWGGAGADLIEGGWGNDRLIADEGQDQLFGGDGDDSLKGWTGAELHGGNGNDSFGQADGSGLVVAYGENGHDRFHMGGDLVVAKGGAGNDVYIVEEGWEGGVGFILDFDIANDWIRIEEFTTASMSFFKDDSGNLAMKFDTGGELHFNNIDYQPGYVFQDFNIYTWFEPDA